MEQKFEDMLDQSRTARRARRSWYLYDFGNSAYAAIVLLAVFSTYFKMWLWAARKARVFGVGQSALLPL